MSLTEKIFGVEIFLAIPKPGESIDESAIEPKPNELFLKKLLLDSENCLLKKFSIVFYLIIIASEVFNNPLMTFAIAAVRYGLIFLFKGFSPIFR